MHTGNCCWWLRTAEFSVYTAAGVLCSGELDATGTDVDNQDSAVRPALRIRINMEEDNSDFEIISGEVCAKHRKETKHSESETNNGCVVETYDENGSLLTKAFYTTLGNRFKVEWYNWRGYIEITNYLIIRIGCVHVLFSVQIRRFCSALNMIIKTEEE